MLEKFQRFGAAMFVPVLLFPFVGILLAVLIVFQNPQLVGSLADPAGMVFKINKVLESGAWAVFIHMPLLFAIGLPIMLAKKAQARAVLVAFITFLTFQYFINAILTMWGSSFGVDFTADVGGTSGLTYIAGIKTLDTSIIGGIIISSIVVYLHNRFFDTKLPDFLGIFQGASFVTIVAFFVMLPMALITCIIWPIIQHGILNLQGFLIHSGSLGVFIYTFLERILIPTGLHHFVYGPFMFGPAVVEGGIVQYYLAHLQEFANYQGSLKDIFPEGGFALHGSSKLWGLPGAALAMYFTAKPENRKILSGLLVSATLTSVLAGITEPIEFTFLFVAPILFVVHAFLAAILATTMYSFGVVGNMSNGILENLAVNWIPMFHNHAGMIATQFIIGLSFTVIYFFVFRFMILKFNLPTPGRGEMMDTKLYKKDDYQEKSQGNAFREKAAVYLELLGGTDNIVSVSNCATRLRVAVVDENLVASESDFKKVGAHGLYQKGTAIQVIIGLDVGNIKEEFQNLITYK
ncbi:MAG: alpha-glucoside-specific PTS transporter subunit IIBC [Alphaproteobacteria bacterium]|jgi:PTS system arbutin-like IIC component|nr:alpha-glucoside-specific PTS transporter subunit IIBC [Alphaproteobacteria bacterium]